MHPFQKSNTLPNDRTPEMDWIDLSRTKYKQTGISQTTRTHQSSEINSTNVYILNDFEVQLSDLQST